MLMEEMPKVWLSSAESGIRVGITTPVPLETAPISPPSTIMIGWAVLSPMMFSRPSDKNVMPPQVLTTLIRTDIPQIRMIVLHGTAAMAFFWSTAPSIKRTPAHAKEISPIFCPKKITPMRTTRIAASVRV